MKALTMMCFLLVFGYGCATRQYQPLVDVKSTMNFSQDNYEQDLKECNCLAEKRTNYMQSATSGALVGAGIGATMGFLFDTDIGSPAAVGAFTGGLTSTGATLIARQNIVIECLRARGYSVIGR